MTINAFTHLASDWENIVAKRIRGIALFSVEVELRTSERAEHIADIFEARKIGTTPAQFCARIEAVDLGRMIGDVAKGQRTTR
jgi:hypothetical protein